MNFNIKEFNIDTISSTPKTNLLPSMPKSSTPTMDMGLSSDDLFGLDSIMNKSKAKKSPSPTSMSGSGITKSGSAPTFTPKSNTPPPAFSSSPEPFKLDFSNSKSAPTSPHMTTKSLNLGGSSSVSKPSSSIPGLSSFSLGGENSINKSSEIPNLDKEIKSLEKGLDADLNAVRSMNSPKLPDFGSGFHATTSTLPNAKSFSPGLVASSDPDNILNLSYEEIQKRKLDLLCKFDRLRSKGVKVMKQYNMSSDYEEMKNEYDTIMKNKRINDSVKWQRKFFITLASGLETFSESSYNPLDFHLTDFGSAVSDDIDSYDDIFEELHLKYIGEGGNYPPELRLLFKLGTTAAWCVYQRKLMESSNMPDFQRVMRENPQLNEQFKQASMNAYQKMNVGNDAEGMGKFMSGMMNQNTGLNDGPPLYDGGMPSSSSNDKVPNLDDILNSL